MSSRFAEDCAHGVWSEPFTTRWGTTARMCLLCATVEEEAS